MSMAAVQTEGARARNLVVLRHASFGLVCRAGSIAASFAAVPLLLQLLGPENVGAWIVLLSVFQWVTFFDLGAAAGARNQLARELAAGRLGSARQSLATGWFYTAAISLGLFAFAAAAMALAPMGRLASVHVFRGHEVGFVLWVVAGAACLSLALGYIQSVYAAFEKASAFSLFSLLTTVSFLLMLLLARHLGGTYSLTQIASMYAGAIIVANLALIARFCQQNPSFVPRWCDVQHALRKPILSFGLRLFVIQLAAMVLFTTDRLMASALLGPASVVVYDAGMKVFAVVTMLHTLLMATLWSSFTRAHQQSDWRWIKQTVAKMLMLMIPLGIGCAALVFATPRIIYVWLGPAQVGPRAFYAVVGVVTFLTCWSNIFAYLLNAIGETRAQLACACTAAALFFPATYVLVNLAGLGLEGIAIALAISLCIFSVVGPLETARILKAHRVFP